MSDEANPYQSPQELPPLAPQGIRFPARPFESGHRRASWTILLLIVGWPLCLARIVFDCAILQFALAHQSHELRNATSVVTNIPFRGLIAGASLAVSVAIPVAFLMWIHRAYRNLPALGATRLDYTPAWAVGWFFVPFISMIRPYYVTAEIWRLSGPLGFRSVDGIAGRRRFSPLLVAW